MKLVYSKNSDRNMEKLSFKAVLIGLILDNRLLYKGNCPLYRSDMLSHYGPCEGGQSETLFRGSSHNSAQLYTKFFCPCKRHLRTYLEKGWVRVNLNDI